jgi:hypothetical protein
MRHYKRERSENVPYWSYNRVKEALSKDLGACLNRDMRPAVIDYISAELCSGKCKIEDVVRAVDARINLEKPVANRPAFIRSMVVAVLHKLYLTELKEDKSTLNFFLEPTIADALATTSVHGLSESDLPDILDPFFVFAPPGIIPFKDRHMEELEFLAVPLPSYTPDQLQICLLIGIVNKDTQLRDVVYLDCIMNTKEPRPLDALLRGDVSTVRTDGGVTAPESEMTCVGRLLFNLMLYWKSQDPDILKQLNPEWEKINQRIHDQRNPKKRERLKKQLRNISKNEYQVIGQKLELIQKRKMSEISQLEVSSGELTGRHVAYHSKTGHWKWQPCGEAKKERKLIFVDTYWAGKNPPREKIGYSVRS